MSLKHATSKNTGAEFLGMIFDSPPPPPYPQSPHQYAYSPYYSLYIAFSVERRVC